LFPALRTQRVDGGNAMEQHNQTNGSAPSPIERIDYHKAVVEARELLAQMDVGYYRLGQLAYEVAEVAQYGDRTLAKFSDDVRVAKCPLDRMQMSTVLGKRF